MTRPPASELREALASSSADVVARALGDIRTHTRVHATELGEYGDVILPAADERLRWAVELCVSEAVPRIFDAWTLAESRDLHAMRILVYQDLAQLLCLLSVHQPNHVHGDAIIARLLDPAAPWMSRLDASVMRAQNMRRDRAASQDAVCVLLALRLLTAMTMYARGKFAAGVWERIHWSSELHAKLASMRRRTSAARSGLEVSIYDMDIRTQYMACLLAMLTQSFHGSLKLAVLDLASTSDVWQGIFRGLVRDPAGIVRYVLLVLYEEVCKDVHVPRGVKAKFLGDHTCAALMGLYTREAELVDGRASSTTVADLVHHFFLRIATQPGFGVCYADHGWYGRDGDGAVLHNKINLALLRKLDAVNDLRQQELALRICGACPELVGPFLSKTSIDVRADQAQCFMSIAFVGRVLQLPVPLPDRSSPPPHFAILQNTAPEPVCRALTKALSHTSALVQYYACTLYACVLERACAFRRIAQRKAHDADEQQGHGVWTQSLHALEWAWRTRLPDIETVTPLLLSAQAMRREAALRVLALYLEAVPSAAFDTHWDAAQLLTQAFLLDTAPASSSPALHWDRVCQAHVLRMLRSSASAGLDIMARVPTPWPGHQSHSFVHFVLVAYTQTGEEMHHTSPAMRGLQSECAVLLRHWLGETAVFSHDPYELDAWLQALLPTDDAGPVHAEVLAFWDECLGRCSKTPYRYAERVREWALEDGDGATGSTTIVSPLLATLWEQACIRLQKDMWDEPQAARITAYMTRLCIALLRYGCAAKPLRALSLKLAEVAPTHASDMCMLMKAACSVPSVPESVSIQDPILASRPDTYAEVIATLSHDDAPFMLHVWLQRLHPDASAGVLACLPLIAQTFDALDTWASQHHMSARALQQCLWQHPTTKTWLYAGDSDHVADAELFLARLVSFAVECASVGSGVRDETKSTLVCDESTSTTVSSTSSAVNLPAFDPAAYRACFALILDTIVDQLSQCPTHPTWLACMTKLAPWASSEHLAQLVHVWPAMHQADEAQLRTLAVLVRHVQADRDALFGLHTQMHTLFQRAPTSEAAADVLDAILQATLPPGLDPFWPQTRGSPAALAHARAHAPQMPLARLDGMRDASLARALYLIPDAVLHSAALPSGPFARLASLELRHASPAPLAPVANLAALLPELVPSCLDDPLACAILSFVYKTCSAPAAQDNSVSRTWIEDAVCAAMQEIPISISMCAPHMTWFVWECGSARMQTTLLDRGLRFLTRRYAEDVHDTPTTMAWTRALAPVVQTLGQVYASVAEPFLAATVQHRCKDRDAIRLALAITHTYTLKNTVAERLLHTLLSHTDMLEVARRGADEPLRRPMVALVVRLARCAHDALSQPTTLARLLYLYTGTLHPCDTALFALLERHARRPLGDVWAAWTTDMSIVPSTLQKDTILTALLSLHPAGTHASCVHMPRTPDQVAHPSREAYAAYDPWLVLNLVGGAMLEREQQEPMGHVHLTGLEWLAILRTGAVGVVACCLSSHRASLRLYATKVLGKMYAALQPTTFREKELVLLALERIRDTLPPPPPTSVHGTYEQVPWLPSITTLFAAHALRAIAMPYHLLFPEMFRFLLQRPRLDTQDVPLLYNLLHSTSDEWRTERAWILRFLGDALHAHAHVAATSHPQGVARAKVEWKVFKRRRIWDLMLSLYAAMADRTSGGHADPNTDQRLASQMEEIMLASASIPHVAHELMTRRGLLAWITLRISSEHGGIEPASDRASFWLTWLWRLCVPPTLAHKDVLARLELIDRQMDGALVTSVLIPATRALTQHGASDTARSLHGMSRACVQPALALVLVLLEYAVLHASSRVRRNAFACIGVLDTIILWIASDRHHEADLDDHALQCVLLLACCGAPEHHVHRLFRSLRICNMHPWTWKPRPWALHSLLQLHRQ